MTFVPGVINQVISLVQSVQYLKVSTQLRGT